MTSRLTSALLAAVREQGRCPDNDPTSTDAILLAEAGRQMATVFVPMVRHARAEWYVAYADLTLTSAQPEYLIPYRAVSSTVRAVVWMPTGGQEIELSPVPLTDQFKYRPGQGAPCVYTIQDDRIVVLPTPSGNLGTLRVWYERTPSELALTSTASAIVSVDSSSASQVVVTVADGNALGAPAALDVMAIKAPYSLKAQDATGYVIAGDQVTYVRPGNGDRVPAVGDWICPAGTTVCPQLPDELHPLLSLATAAEWLSRIDPEAGAPLRAQLEKQVVIAQSLLASRQLGRQMKLKSEHSMMRRGGGLRRGGFSDWNG